MVVLDTEVNNYQGIWKVDLSNYVGPKYTSSARTGVVICLCCHICNLKTSEHANIESFKHHTSIIERYIKVGFVGTLS